MYKMLQMLQNKKNNLNVKGKTISYEDFSELNIPQAQT